MISCQTSRRDWPVRKEPARCSNRVWSDAYATSASDGYYAIATSSAAVVYVAGFTGATEKGAGGTQDACRSTQKQSAHGAEALRPRPATFLRNIHMHG